MTPFGKTNKQFMTLPNWGRSSVKETDMSTPNDDFTTKPGFIARARKAVTAFVTGFAGGAAASLTAAIPDGISVDEYAQAGWSALGLGVIAALLVYAVPNASE